MTVTCYYFCSFVMFSLMSRVFLEIVFLECFLRLEVHSFLLIVSDRSVLKYIILMRFSEKSNDFFNVYDFACGKIVSNDFWSRKFLFPEQKIRFCGRKLTAILQIIFQRQNFEYVVKIIFRLSLKKWVKNC